MEFTVEGPLFETSSICVPIIRLLPSWFGIEEAILQYESEMDALPTFLARRSEIVLGFLCLKQHNPYSAEVYVMGIRPEAHRHGIGRALMHHAQAWLKLHVTEYLQVKTLSSSNADPNYAKTRLFYLSMGFRPLEEFKQIWDEHNPCLLLIKRL